MASFVLLVIGTLHLCLLCCLFCGYHLQVLSFHMFGVYEIALHLMRNYWEIVRERVWFCWSVLSQRFGIELLELTPLSSSEFKGIYLRTQRDRGKSKRSEEKEGEFRCNPINMSVRSSFDWCVCVYTKMWGNAFKNTKTRQNFSEPPIPT